MFRFVPVLTTILACSQFALGSNLHGALYAPTSALILGRYGDRHGILSGNIAVPAASVISSHSSTIVHPNSYPTISRSVPNVGHQQYISAVPSLSHQIYSSPLVSGGLYGHNNGLHAAAAAANSYAIQRSYTTPLVAPSGYPTHHGLYGVPIVASAYGAPHFHAHGGYSGHHSAW